MNIYSFSVLVFAIGSIFMAIQILLKRKDDVAVIYFGLSCLYTMWGIGVAFSTNGAMPYEMSLTFFRLSQVFAAFIPVAWLHFCNIYVHPRRKTGQFFYFLYLLPVSIVPFTFSNFFISGLKPIREFKYYPIPQAFFYLHTAIYFVLIPIGFCVLWKFIKGLSGEEQKKQMGFLIVAFLGYLGGGLSFLPVYDIPIPQYGLFLLPLYPFGKAYFMSSRGLFDEEHMAQAAHKDKLAALGILTASINHEIRAPLFVMRAMAETQEKDKHLSQNFLNQIDRITGIVSRLTHFAKKGVDEAAKIESVDLQEVLTDIRPLFQHQLNYQQIEYSQEVAVDLPKVLADRRYLEEILFNLILNACQAIKNTQGPRIKLSACVFENQRPKTENRSVSRQSSVVSPASITIVIEDNGPGISSEQTKHIFKPFHTTKTEGTGLGLYITKQLVERCGGTINVLSEVGTGAKFIVNLKGV